MMINGLDVSNRVMIVAEIGNNHEGQFELAEKMIAQAAACGVDAVKFQVIIPEQLVGPDQVVRLAALRRFQLSFEQYIRLSILAHQMGLLFIVSPFALEAVDAMAPYVDAFKIASGDNTFYPLLEKVILSKHPFMVSTGLLNMEGVESCYSFILSSNKGLANNFALLHCVCSYPVPMEQAHLSSILAMKQRYPCDIGYSDHTLGLEAPVLAVAAGARIIEKHFTLDKHFSDHRDHQLSADPEELSELVRRIRNTEGYMGSGAPIMMSSCEFPNLQAARRSIAAAHDLRVGARIEWQDLAWLRPGGGFKPGEEQRVLGKQVLRPISAGAQITPDSII